MVHDRPRNHIRRIAVLVAAALALGLISQASVAATEEPASRNLAAGLGYTWSEPPDAATPDKGKELTDGEYGQLDHKDPAWVGHTEGKTCQIVFDLGDKKSISRIEAHFLQDWPTSSILVPLTVSMYVSDDKQSWAMLAHKSTQLLWGEGPPRDETYAWDGEIDGLPEGSPEATMAYAKYVKVTFTVHTSASQLVDEVEIIGVDGRTPQAKTPKVDEPGYLAPGPETAGIHDLALLYNGHYASGKGAWTKDEIVPYLSYVDKDGDPVEPLFDGILYLGLQSPSGHNFGVGDARAEDWQWYLEKTFADSGDLQQLNAATMEVADNLDKPGLRTKVVLMIPNPGERLTDFGDVDGDGVSENVNAAEVGAEQALANREKIVRWWIDALEERWTKAGFSHLRLTGLYWLHEQISTSATGPDLVRSVSKLVHHKGLELFWIPHFLAYKSHLWSEVGIDAAAFQPNYFFEQMNAERIEDAANTARQYGMGVEVEFDERMLTDEVFRQRFVEYLDGGVEHGYMAKAFNAYYQGNDAVLQAARSDNPQVRILYDWLHEYVRGSYQPDGRGGAGITTSS